MASSKKNQIKENNDNIKNYEDQEKKELISYKMQLLTKVYFLNKQQEKNEITGKLEKFDEEKINYQLQYKTILEEDCCRYGATNSKERWPVLNNKYLILTLLGKGGYSEVYKVYIN